MDLNEMIGALPPAPTDFDEQLRSVYASMGTPELLVRIWEGDDMDALLGETTDQWAYHCTACGQSGMTPKKGVRMKDFTRCPLCGARVQPARWGWLGKPLRRALVYTVHRGAGRAIWVRCWRTTLIQEPQYAGSYFDVSRVAAYLFEDGRAVKLSPKWDSNGRRTWVQRKQVTGETWRENTYSKTRLPAFVLPISWETMRGSCLEYSQLNRALDLELPVIEYLAWYTKYPAVEYLWKMGHARLIVQKLTECSGQLIRQAVNLRAKTPKELFRCADKRFLRMLPGLRAEEITMFRRLFETGAVEADEAGRSWAVVMAHTACALPEAESAGLRRYITRQAARTGHGLENTLLDYMDYRRQAAQFGAPLWPNDLQLSHARLSARERATVNRRSNELFRARRHLWRWAVWHWNGMLIRPVDSAFEIVREGEQNDNCVASYANAHMEGRKIIFVLRRVDRPRESWHTVELMPDTLKVVQCRGCHNAPATPEAREFIGLWTARLRAMRSERSKST